MKLFFILCILIYLVYLVGGCSRSYDFMIERDAQFQKALQETKPPIEPDVPISVKKEGNSLEKDSYL